MQKDKEQTVEVIQVSSERVVTIRCLSAIPEEVEALLASIAEEEEAKAEGK